MSERQRWNLRYQQNPRPSFEPSYVLSCYQHLLPSQGRALDLACGSGGNALLLAAHGLDTEAWDIADMALAHLDKEAEQRQLSITTRAMDIVAGSLTEQSFEVICVSRYLDRNLCPAIMDALTPGGLLFYQTFTRSRISDHGPGNPAYRLADNELLQLFQGLRVLAYREEGAQGDPQQGWRDEALLVAQRF